MFFFRSGVALAIILATVLFINSSSAFALEAGDTKVVANAPVTTKVSDSVKEVVDAKVKSENYQVVEGDTLQAIADRFNTSVAQLVSDNSIENPDLINVGVEIKVVPGTTDVDGADYSTLDSAVSSFLTPRPVRSAPTIVSSSVQSRSAAAVTTGGVAAGGLGSVYLGNGWWCTDYVHSMRPDVPVYGNAGYNWISAAQAQGKATGSTPQVGAIAVMPGHVAYVEQVNSDGSYIVSEMGWNYQQGNFNRRLVQPGGFGAFIY